MTTQNSNQLDRPSDFSEGAGMTYDQIAQVFGISRVRVMAIERQALAKLKRGLNKVGVYTSKPASD